MYRSMQHGKMWHENDQLTEFCIETTEFLVDLRLRTCNANFHTMLTEHQNAHTHLAVIGKPSNRIMYNKHYIKHIQYNTTVYCIHVQLHCLLIPILAWVPILANHLWCIGFRTMARDQVDEQHKVQSVQPPSPHFLELQWAPPYSRNLFFIGQR